VLESGTAALTTPGRLGQRLMHSVSWHTLGTVFNQGSTLLVAVLLANLLGREQFGVFATVQTTVITLAGVAQLATGYTATRFLAEFRDVDQARAARILRICARFAQASASLACVVLLATADVVAVRVLEIPDVAPALRLGAIVVLFTVYNAYQIGALAGLDGFRPLGIAGVISGASYLALCTLGAVASGLVGALAGMALTGLLQCVLLYYLLRRRVSRVGLPAPSGSFWCERRVLTGFALPASLAGLSSMGTVWYTGVFLIRQDGGLTEMALYSAANNFKVLILFLPNMINAVALSLLNNQRGLGRFDQFRRVYSANIALMTLTAAFGLAAVLLMGPELLGVFGSTFLSGLPVLKVLAIAALPEAIWLGLYQALQSRGNMWLSLCVVAVPRDLIILALCVAWVPHLGALGLAEAYLIAQFTLMILIGALVSVGGLIPGAAPVGLPGEAHRRIEA
jgi:O-antigen/teichoic acid export membrane protein